MSGCMGLSLRVLAFTGQQGSTSDESRSAYWRARPQRRAHGAQRRRRDVHQLAHSRVTPLSGALARHSNPAARTSRQAASAAGADG